MIVQVASTLNMGTMVETQDLLSDYVEGCLHRVIAKGGG
jgi:hypothetical protein